MSEAQKISGRVIKVLAPTSGTGKKEWSKQSFVIETSGQYPKMIAFQAWNDRCNLIPDEETEVTVFYSPESREYNDKWYTDLNVFNIEVSGAKPKEAKKAEPVKSGLNLEVANEEDDLPF